MARHNNTRHQGQLLLTSAPSRRTDGTNAARLPCSGSASLIHPPRAPPEALLPWSVRVCSGCRRRCRRQPGTMPLCRLTLELLPRPSAHSSSNLSQPSRTPATPCTFSTRVDVHVALRKAPHPPGSHPPVGCTQSKEWACPRARRCRAGRRAPRGGAPRRSSAACRRRIHSVQTSCSRSQRSRRSARCSTTRRPHAAYARASRLCCCSCARLAARRCLAFVVTWEAEPPSAVLHAVDLCGRRCVACRSPSQLQRRRIVLGTVSLIHTQLHSRFG